jgi:hypothetical protein
MAYDLQTPTKLMSGVSGVKALAENADVFRGTVNETTPVLALWSN